MTARIRRSFSGLGQVGSVIEKRCRPGLGSRTWGYASPAQDPGWGRSDAYEPGAARRPDATLAAKRQITNPCLLGLVVVDV